MNCYKLCLTAFITFMPCLLFAETPKLSEDPTKIVTKLGLGYSNNYDFDNSTLKFSGSLALDAVRKINASIKSDGDEWSIGGSWLFKIGIVNFRFAETTLDNDISQTSYSVGTFMPLSIFGFKPYDIQIFPMAGYTYTESELDCNTVNCELIQPPTLGDDFAFISSTSNSGYLGALALKPLTKQVTAMAMTGGALGSNDYSAYWLGGGVGVTLNSYHNIRVYSYYMDNSYGTNTGLGADYVYQFN